MSSSLNRIKKNIIEAMQSANNQSTSAYDSVAEVRRVDGDTAWVHIAGGVDETPVKLTIAAKAGDVVQVRVGGGRAWITGNASAPPTDDKTAIAAKGLANIAGNRANAAQKTADQAQIVANSALKGAKENAAQMAQMVINFNGDIENLQDQIDGNITTWFYDADPAMNLPPVTDWDTDGEKDAHLGDIYYDTVKGYAWRFMKSGSIYSWERITDTDVTKALADAAKAQDTADSKRRVFYSTPTVPYDAGDLWVQGSGGDILRCAQAKTGTGSYDRNDWVLASKYTDNSALNTWIEGDFATTIKELEDGLVDAKIETYYQTTDPSTGWSDTQKSEHKGDLWYNSTASVQGYYRWSGTAWQELTATPPQAVFDNIDRKATIYIGTTTPTNPESGDLWFKGANEPILTYVNNSWVEYNKYTDDTAANTAKATADTAQSTATAAQSAADYAARAATTAQTTADKASAAASTAQSSADTAAQAASKAQSTAETAKEDAATAQTAADTAKEDAKAAQSTADTVKENAATAQSGVDTLNAYIRSSDDGVEVARKDVDGNYVGYKTIHTPDGVEVRTADDVVVARYGNSVKIGQDSGYAKITSESISLANGAGAAFDVDFGSAGIRVVETFGGRLFKRNTNYTTGEVGRIAHHTRFPVSDYSGKFWADWKYTGASGNTLAGKLNVSITKGDITGTADLGDYGTLNWSLLFDAYYNVKGISVGVQVDEIGASVLFESFNWDYMTTADAACQVSTGVNPDKTVPYAFLVGNGSADTPSNAFLVDWDGNVTAKGNITAGGSIVMNGTNISSIFSGVISVGYEDKKLNLSAGGNTGDSTISLSKDGYSARCICGWNMSGTGASNCTISKLFINQTDQQLHYYVKNTGSSKATLTIRTYILYTKSNLPQLQ